MVLSIQSWVVEDGVGDAWNGLQLALEAQDLQP